MINPAQYIAFIDTLNELEQKAKKIKRFGLPTSVGEELSKAFEDYSIQWDSDADRWTLVSETDDAPNLCSFNQTEDECSELDYCEQCLAVKERLAEDYDNEMARRGY
ncbi:hypothetical protein SEA_MICRODON_79 [Streptomyces phage Microdon]|nr:hypothetical protein SEA_MICRODON_79 [Streptomyces phage Microdon]